MSSWSTGEWHPIERRAIARLSFHPEPGDAAGSLDVLVEQESTGNVARVEFGFDPEALGPGCYTVE